MNEKICDICGREKRPYDNIMIDGKVRVCSRKEFDKGSTVLISSENRDVYLCGRCAERILSITKAMSEKKRITIGALKKTEL